MVPFTFKFGNRAQLQSDLDALRWRTPQLWVGNGLYAGPLHMALLVCLRILAIGYKWPHVRVHLLCLLRESTTLAHWSFPSQVFKQGHRDSNRIKTLATTRSHAHRIHYMEKINNWRGLYLVDFSKIRQTARLKTVPNFPTIRYVHCGKSARDNKWVFSDTTSAPRLHRVHCVQCVISALGCFAPSSFVIRIP